MEPLSRPRTQQSCRLLPSLTRRHLPYQPTSGKLLVTSPNHHLPGDLVITIGTWNLENLFRPGDDAGPQLQAAYQAKLTALAGTITELAPDVLAVQEVGDPEALANLAERLVGTWHIALANPGRY